MTTKDRIDLFMGTLAICTVVACVLFFGIHAALPSGAPWWAFPLIDIGLVSLAALWLAIER